MSMGMSNAIFEFCMRHSDDPGSRTEGIPERDPQDYDWLRNALAEIKSDYERMESCLKIASDPQVTDVESKAIAMEEILYFVEDLDNASDFCKKIKGSRILLAMLHPDTPDVLREGAANLLGTCCQNNIICQGIVLTDGGLQVILEQLRRESHTGSRTKLLYALSSLVRGNRAMLTAFFQAEGAVSAVTDVLCQHGDDLRSVKKALFLLACVWRDDPDMQGRPEPPASAEVLTALRTFLKNDGMDVQDMAVDYAIELVKHGKAAALKEAGITAGDVQCSEHQERLAAVLK